MTSVKRVFLPATLLLGVLLLWPFTVRAAEGGMAVGKDGLPCGSGVIVKDGRAVMINRPCPGFKVKVKPSTVRKTPLPKQLGRYQQPAKPVPSAEVEEMKKAAMKELNTWRESLPQEPQSKEKTVPRILVLLCLALLAAAVYVAKTRRAPEKDAVRSAHEPAVPASARPEEVMLANKYRVQRLLGRGGMGEVWEALDTTRNRKVAIKRLRKAWFSEENSAARDLFLKEARTLESLDHPNIVHVHESLWTGYEVVLVFEIVNGESLRQILNEKKSLPWAQAARIAGSIGEALDYAHGHGIVHRDLKPENILIPKSGPLKVADFGIARVLQHRPGDRSASLETAQTRTIAGTPDYMAPESVLGIVTSSADIFSLGVCLYEMITGWRPFSHPEQRGSGDLPPASAMVSGLPAGIDAFLNHALEIDYKKRIPNAKDFLTALKALAPKNPGV